MENNKYVFGENSLFSKRAKIDACYSGSDISKSEIGYAFGNSNPDMNSLKFDRKGEELINMLSNKKDSLQEKYNVLQTNMLASKAVIIEQGFTFKTSLDDNYDTVNWDYNAVTDEQRNLIYAYQDLFYPMRRLKEEIKTCQTLIDNLDSKKKYSLSTPQLISLQKALDFDIEKSETTGNVPVGKETIEKSEGARGGKVIGHTKSGKPIYDTNVKHNVLGLEGSHHDFVNDHSHFTSKDHKDAVDIHIKRHEHHGKEWQKHHDSVTPNEWNNENNEKGKKAFEGTKEANKQQEKHSTLAKWHEEAAKKKSTNSEKEIKKSEENSDIKKAFESLGL